MASSTLLHLCKIGTAKQGPSVSCVQAGAHLVFTLHAFNIDIKMQLSHSANDGLPALCIQADLEGGILFCEAIERFGKGTLVPSDLSRWAPEQSPFLNRTFKTRLQQVSQSKRPFLPVCLQG